MVKHGIALALMALGVSTASAAEIKVYSGGAPQPVLRVLAPAFEQASGHKVAFTFQIVSQLRQRIAGGDVPDLIMMPQQLVAAVEKDVPLRAEGRGVLAKVGIGMIVREGAPRPDLSDEEAVKKALRSAKAVALADPSTPSGRYLSAMLTRLGLAEELKSRLVHKGAIHGGGELVARGEADLGLYLVSEVNTIKGVTVAGMLPPALQSHVVYATAIPVSNQAPDPALAFIRFLTAPENAARWKQAGFEPAASP